MTTTITLEDLQEKIKIALECTEGQRLESMRRYTLNAIRFLVGDEMYNEAMKLVNE